MSDKSVGRVGVELEAAEALAALSHHVISTTEDQPGRFCHPFKNANHQSFTIPHDRSEVLRQNTNTISSMVMHSERAEQELNRMNYRVLGSGSCIRSRNHLTEDEREQKRIRRILANRESARQTIRRRQVMYEQLIKNAAVLEMENENLKTAKEQVLSKFSSLKSMNERLKDMLDKAAKAEAFKEQCGDPELGPIKTSTSSTTPSFPSVVPFFWPPFFHSPDVYSGEAMHKSNGMGAPVYVLPFPMFFPIQMQCTPQSSHQPSLQYIRNEGPMEDIHASNAEKMNSEITRVTMSASRDCGTGKQIAEEPHEDEMVEVEAVSPSAWGLATKSEIPIHCPSQKSGCTAAAAEARRRRKELTKLKRLYYRNHRMR